MVSLSSEQCMYGWPLRKLKVNFVNCKNSRVGKEKKCKVLGFMVDEE
jgi:hypothetical protein